jgi:hypothetical protein
MIKDRLVLPTSHKDQTLHIQHSALGLALIDSAVVAIAQHNMPGTDMDMPTGAAASNRP